MSAHPGEFDPSGVNEPGEGPREGGKAGGRDVPTSTLDLEERVLVSEIERVSLLVQSGRFKDALAQLAPLLADIPDNPGLWHLAAIAHLGANELDRGEQACRRALTLDPDHPVLHLLLGRVLLARGEMQEALQCAYTALERDPSLVDAHVFIAHALAQVNRELPRALWHAERARDLAPDQPDGHRTVGIVQSCFAKPRSSSAVAMAAFQASLRLDPQDDDAWNGIGLTHMQRYRPIRATQAFVTALRINPRSDNAAHNLPLGVGAVVLYGRWLLLGLLPLSSNFAEAVEAASRSGWWVQLLTQACGLLVVALVAWWVLWRRPLKPFRPDTAAARRVLLSDAFVRPSWLGMAWLALCEGVMVLLGHVWEPLSGLLVLVAVLGFVAGGLFSRWRLSRMRKRLERERVELWRGAVV